MFNGLFGLLSNDIGIDLGTANTLVYVKDHGIVLLNGGGFAAPDWSVRISFANLEDHVYDDIGRAVRTIARGYRQAYEADKGKNGKAAGKKAPKAKKR